MKAVALAILALLAAVPLAACSGDEEASQPLVRLRHELSLSAKDLAAGRPLELTLEVTNTGEPLTVYYRNAQRYDFQVADSDGNEVWSWSRGRAFAEVLGEETLDEDQVVTYRATWDGRRNDGEEAAPGEYEVIASTMFCSDIALENCGVSSSTRFEVTE